MLGLHLASYLPDVLCFPAFRFSKGLSLGLIAKQKVHIRHSFCESLLEGGNLHCTVHAPGLCGLQVQLCMALWYVLMEKVYKPISVKCRDTKHLHLQYCSITGLMYVFWPSMLCTSRAVHAEQISSIKQARRRNRLNIVKIRWEVQR